MEELETVVIIMNFPESELPTGVLIIERPDSVLANDLLLEIEGYVKTLTGTRLDQTDAVEKYLAKRDLCARYLSSIGEIDIWDEVEEEE